MSPIQLMLKLRELPKLPHALYRVASFFELHYEDVPFLTVEQIAEASHTSKASVVRLVQRLGYEQFGDLRDELRQELYRGSPAVRLAEIASTSTRDASEILDKYRTQEWRNLSRTLDTLEPDAVWQFCKTLVAASRVWVYGQRFSYGLAFNFGLFLSQLLPDVTTVSGSGGTSADAFAHSKPTDHVIIIAHKRIGAEKAKLANYLTSRNIPFSVITDVPDQPEFKNATSVLQTFTEPVGVFNCYASTYLLLQAVASVLELVAPTASSTLATAEVALQRLNAFQQPGGKGV